MKEDLKPVESRRTIEFGDNAELIQKDANNHCNGNFTKAVNEVVTLGLKERKRQEKQLNK